MRDGDRLFALAQPRDEILGVLALFDPEGTAGPHDAFALEHGALVLAAELSHLRGLGEMELRLRGDLVDDLCTGTDDESAHARAQAIGYDLHRPHAVVVIQGRGKASGEALARSVEQSAAGLEIGSLVGRRQGAVVLLALLRPEAETGGRRTGGPGGAEPPQAREATRGEAWTNLAETLSAEFPSGA